MDAAPRSWSENKFCGLGIGMLVRARVLWCRGEGALLSEGGGCGVGARRRRERCNHPPTSHIAQWDVAGAGAQVRACVVEADSWACVGVSRDACALPHALRGFCVEWAVLFSSTSGRGFSSLLRRGGHGVCAISARVGDAEGAGGQHDNTVGVCAVPDDS
jgi:hypothetical protein